MVKALSGGRLNIQHFAAGELIPALEGFDAVSAAFTYLLICIRFACACRA